MTTQEEYEAHADTLVRWAEEAFAESFPVDAGTCAIAARVLRALADGAVLCKEDCLSEGCPWEPLDPQP